METFRTWLEKRGVKKTPPKDWWDRCVDAVADDSDDPPRLCGWIWYHQMSDEAKRRAVQKK